MHCRLVQGLVFPVINTATHHFFKTLSRVVWLSQHPKALSFSVSPTIGMLFGNRKGRNTMWKGCVGNAKPRFSPEKNSSNKLFVFFWWGERYTSCCLHGKSAFGSSLHGVESVHCLLCCIENPKGMITGGQNLKGLCSSWRKNYSLIPSIPVST